MADEFDINKTKDKILKLFKQSESERKLENFGAADLFEAKYKELLKKYNLELRDILVPETQTSQIKNELGITIVPYTFGRINARNTKRELWFEELGKVIANGYGCYATTINNQGEVGFFGLDFDREMAVFMFLELASVANTFASERKKEVIKSVGSFSLKSGKIDLPEWPGDEVFFESFHYGFRKSLKEIYLKYLANDDYRNKLNNAQVFMSQERARYYGYLQDLKLGQVNDYIVSLGELAGRNAVRLSQKDNNQAIKGKSQGLIKSNKPKASESLNKPTVIGLIDGSGSMSGYRIEEAKNGALDFLHGMGSQGYNVGLMAFGSQVKNVVTPKPFDEKFFAKAVNTVKANLGGTNMAMAIRAAKSRFISSRQRRILLIITDGGTTDGIENTLNAAKELKQLGIEIAAIGCAGADEEFLKKLASKDDLAQYVSEDRLRLTMGDMVKRLGA